MTDDPGRGTYGARFLTELRARLHSTAGLKYATIQRLEGADREEFGRILRRELTGLTYAVNKMLEEEEPEALARWFAEELQRFAEELQKRNTTASAAALFFFSG